MSAAPVILGSLTQPGARTGTVCAECGSDRVTHVHMTLTDGTPVDFVSCLACEHRTWNAEGKPLNLKRVLKKAEKRR
jgi:hypothetical protein